MIQEELEQRLRFCGNLPSLPAVALKMVDMANNPEVELADVARVISMDPALVTKLFRAASSPLYGTNRKINNLRQVLGMLGLQGTLALALGFSLITTGKNQKIPLHTDNFWRRSLLTATACRFLGERLSIKNLEELFLAGLLQSIGVLALALIMPEDYAPLLEEATQPALHSDEKILNYQYLAQLERECLGSDHAAAGAWLLRHWRLPDYLYQATAASLDPEHEPIAEKYQALARCVALATRISDLLVSPDYAPQVSDQVAECAAAWFALDSVQYLEILDAVAAKFPHITTLFQIKALDAAQIAGIVDQAREALEIRSVQRWPTRLGGGSTQTNTVAPSLPRQLPDAPPALSARTSAASTHSSAGNTYAFDALTGLFTRQHLHKRLRKELHSAHAQQQPLSVVLLDLDACRKINHNFGRSVGDQILIALSRLLDSNVRRQDWVARYGADEFALVLPGLASAAARHCAEQMLGMIRDWEPALANGENLRVTASAGVSSYAGLTALDDECAWRLLASAEQALQLAQHSGGNCLMLTAAHI